MADPALAQDVQRHAALLPALEDFAALRSSRGLAVASTVGRRDVGVLYDIPVEFKVELKEPEPRLLPSVPVGAGTFNLERSTLVSRTRPGRR